eukprot:CAMPEP_0118717460 /NCGR_PEP_ID=MMETSP0800-20121206/28172_1 /TAXON_ID=210618 ORGANISM="Striatella unipunctata, Strain CCMP2910" /NCGR_SAMPLE_ID=MMETSP0800 /ASSEMBLY_ACC=CAM_ASM_000638 /LENGTH=95 /DNA_ID=CAMNT_0006624201 /DNA_START=178 /DNA_END=465 /DNA_ORIENTATION=+
MNDEVYAYHRCCELIALHKDIFKKHVVGLVLSYMNGVEQKGGGKRSGLVRCVFSWLDTFSSHEWSQCNASMNTTQRTLFQSIYQTYQKTHQYKGQ